MFMMMENFIKCAGIFSLKINPHHVVDFFYLYFFPHVHYFIIINKKMKSLHGSMQHSSEK